MPGISLPGSSTTYFAVWLIVPRKHSFGDRDQHLRSRPIPGLKQTLPLHHPHTHFLWLKCLITLNAVLRFMDIIESLTTHRIFLWGHCWIIILKNARIQLLSWGLQGVRVLQSVRCLSSSFQWYIWANTLLSKCMGICKWIVISWKGLKNLCHTADSTDSATTDDVYKSWAL